MSSPEFFLEQRSRIESVYDSFVPRLQKYNPAVAWSTDYRQNDHHPIFADIEFLSQKDWPHYDVALQLILLNRGDGRLSFRTEINERFSDTLLIFGPTGSIDLNDPVLESWVIALVDKSVRFFEDHFDDVRDKVCPDNPSGRDLR